MPGSINYRTADIPDLLCDINVKLLLKLVEQHPEWPITLFVAQHPRNKNSKKRRFTLEEATIVLKRLQLFSQSQRRTYALYTIHVQSLSDLQPIDYDTVDMTTLLSDTRVQRLLELASAYPHLASTQLLSKLPKNMKGVPILTYAQVKIILARLKLATIADRMQRMGLSEEPIKPSAHQTIPQALTSLSQYTQYKHQEHQHIREQPGSPHPLPHTEPPAPPPPARYTPVQQATFRRYDRFFSLTKQFVLTALFSFLFFLSGSFVLSMLFHAHGGVQRLGLFFSFSALFFGLFFFLYSLKYYVTIVVMLSFSRANQPEKDRQRGIGSFLSQLFGISITIEDKQAGAGKEQPQKPTLSLQYDLSQVTLERNPFVSIHVATYNEKRVIDRFLLAATSMEYENYEVIVADDSTDDTVQLLEQWKNHPRVKISHRQTREGYKGAALAHALTQVDPRTEFLLVFDADFIPYPDTILQFLKYFQAMIGTLQPDPISKSPIAAVQGYQWHILNKSENWITRGIRTEYAGSYVVERSGTEVYQGLKQISGSVYMIRRDVLQQTGWGESITEDFELTLKLYQQGYKVMYTPYIQTPAEAVSTIKRLIRQRMRWAEGHSFNIKKMFWSLMLGTAQPSSSSSGSNQNTKVVRQSPLTWREKLELVYLAPYYLQAGFFIAGTLAWFIAEVIFQTRLPFWTEVWGWSLVFTNLFALPLMNFVGLFMEESEEKDYIGLLSFIILSYIVAPFQAFAAVKGFLEKEEGPWFRTPKTGRITDSFVPGQFYHLVKGLFGRPTTGSALSSVFAPHNHAAVVPLQPAFTLSNSSTDSRRRGMHWRGKAILAVFLLITILLNYLSFLTPKAQAASNPTIEQQINLTDSWQNSGSTSNGIVLIDTAKYTGATYYFEVDAHVSSGGNGTAVLTYNAGTGATPSGGSTLTISSITATTWTRYRSASFSPTGAQNAYISSLTGTGIAVQAARIIVVQTDPNLLSNTVTQIEVGNNNEQTASTSYAVLANPKYWNYDGTKYDGTVTVYFEAVLNDTSAQTAYASLYVSGSSCSTQVSGSEVSVTGTTTQRVRSGAITLSNGTEYMVCLHGGAGTDKAVLSEAKIIIVQNATGGITQVELPHYYLNTQTAFTNTSYTSQGFLNQYNPSNWAGGTFTYSFEAMLNTASGTTANAEQYNATDGSAISGSPVNTTNTSYTRVRSGSITMPATSKDMDTAIAITGSGTANIAGSWLIIDVSSLQTPENLLPLFPLALFLPQVVAAFRKRRVPSLSLSGKKPTRRDKNTPG